MKILLLAGGDSSEREVSLNSGKAVYEALKRLGHIVYAIDSASGKSLLNRDGSFIEFNAEDASKQKSSSKGGSWSLSSSLGSPGFQDIEVVFIALHGGAGENGMIQCLLDLAGKRYTGSNMVASAIAMDKAIAKRLAASENIPTPNWVLYSLKHCHIDEELTEDITNRFDYPIIVKPNDSGSTIGLTKVVSDSELPSALEKALNESGNILVEKFIKGREITATVLDGKAYPLVEIIPENELYDYEAKYTEGKSHYEVPAKIEDEIVKKIQHDAVKIYNIISASGLARVDFILDERNNYYFLELNTLPGMTQLSLAPMAVKAVGIEFDELIDRLIKTTIEQECG